MNSFFDLLDKYKYPILAVLLTFFGALFYLLFNSYEKSWEVEGWNFKNEVKVEIAKDELEIDDILNVIEGSLFYIGKGGQATIEAFHCIAAADIIIGSKSGFTQVAAVVGAGGGFSLKILVRIYKLDIHT